ncbi:four helix bundle protein [Candidatus Falkowbacteria bacterium]|nr:four helix bundle protein [Candidatus Falkowbacteria bacterium]
MDNKEYKTFLKEKVYRFSLAIIRFIDQLDKKDFSVQVIVRQMLRSATSIGANIIEAQACGSKKDFTNFINIALKSANETKYWLALLRDSGKGDRVAINKLLVEVTEIANLLGSSILKFKGRK